MENGLKEYFHYTRSERNGMLVLTTLCVIILIVPAVFKHLFKKESQTDFSQFQSQIDSFYQKTEAGNVALSEIRLFPFDPNFAAVEDFQKLGLSEKVASTIQNYRNKGGKFYKKEDFKKIYGIEEEDYKRLEKYIVLEVENRNHETEPAFFEETKREIELFEFDPNTVSEEELKRLGLSERAIKIMMNYRKKGGTFRKREELSKIYGITDDDFERLFPYIKISEKAPEKVFENNENAEISKLSENPKKENVYKNIESLKIEINSASPEEWQQIRGIGPKYSKWICGFRDKLGGFVSINQISETYNLPDSTFQSIKPFLVLKEPVKKINLNTASAKKLAAHPYLKWNQANAIIKYRDQHGNFKNVDQLGNIKILNQKTLQKIKPYLKIE